MKKIDNISSIDGRLLLREIFYKLRFERQRSSFATLFILWRICTVETETNKYINKDITIMHKLGFFRGTSIWLEEIVNRYYFSTINSFVYFGAAILLVLIGINTFSDKVSNTTVLYGLLFEASLLFLMFFVMLFTPNEDISNLDSNLLNTNEENENFERELLDEIGEISRDFAHTSSQLEKITDHLLTVVDRQNELTAIFSDIAKTNAEAINPNPKMLEIMNETNETLIKFKDNIAELNETTNQLKQEEIQIVVRKELENFFTKKISE